MKHFRDIAPLLALLCVAGLVGAQESASYKLKEHTLNEGGNPDGGVVLESASYKLTLDAIGDSVAEAGTLSSTNYKGEAGFVPPYPPPEEVLNLLFTDEQTLVWDPEKSVGAYKLFRGLLTDLPAADYGDCTQRLSVNTAMDASTPPAGETYFYLVTAENRLEEEGTMGEDSTPAERPNTSPPCP
jgi:hypothetical protein